MKPSSLCFPPQYVAWVRLEVKPQARFEDAVGWAQIQSGQVPKRVHLWEPPVPVNSQLKCKIIFQEKREFCRDTVSNWVSYPGTKMERNFFKFPANLGQIVNINWGFPGAAFWRGASCMRGILVRPWTTLQLLWRLPRQITRPGGQVSHASSLP